MKKYVHLLQFDNIYIEGFAIAIWILSFHQIYFLILFFCYLYFLRKQIKWLRLMICVIVISLSFFIIVQQQSIIHISGKAKVIDIKDYDTYERVTIRYQFKTYHIYDYQNLYEIGDHLYLDGDIVSYKHETIPFGFDFNEYFLSNGVYGKVENIKNLSIDHGFHINTYRIHLLEKQDNEYIKALIFGQAFNDTEMESIYQYLDILFLLNVSGLHVYMFILILKKIGFYLNIENKHQKIMIFIVYVLILYLSHMDLSVFRLMIVFIISIFNGHFELRLKKIDQHMIAFFICLCLNIYLIYSLSFLMMFMIVMILQITSFLYEKQSPMIKKYMIALMILICLSPLQNHLSLSYYMLSPFYIGLFCYVIYPLSWITLILPKFNVVFQIIISKVHALMYMLETYEINIVYHRLASIGIIIAYACIIMTLLSKTHKQVLVRILICLFVFYMPTIKFNYINEDLFYMMDVGQGDGFYMKTGDMHIVVDAFSQTTNFLENHGIRHIDYLILTHSDEDHTKEAHMIIERFEVSEVLISAYDTSYDKFDAHVRLIKADDQIILKEQTIKFYNPIYDYQDANNNSLVFKIKLGIYDFLMTGDIEEIAEIKIVEKYGNLIKSDVLKVAHHGSMSSTSKIFLETVSPKIALISVGLDNRFDFPAQQTINRLNERAIKIYRSDIDGTVIYQYQFKKGKWMVYL